MEKTRSPRIPLVVQGPTRCCCHGRFELAISRTIYQTGSFLRDAAVPLTRLVTARESAHSRPLEIMMIL